MSAAPDDSVILVAFDGWKEARRAYRALPTGGPLRPASTEDSNGYTPEENRRLAQMDGAEILIRHCSARSLQGVIAQLLIAINHIESCDVTETTILDGDMDALFAMDESLDWGPRMILSAIRSLREMGGLS